MKLSIAKKFNTVEKPGNAKTALFVTKIQEEMGGSKWELKI